MIPNLTQHSPQMIRSIQMACRHEAGHYLVAMKLGFSGLGIIVEMAQDGSHKGGAVMSPARPVREVSGVEMYLKWRIAVLYAGAIAQCSKRGQVDGEGLERSLRTNASGDYAKLHELLSLLRNLLHPDTTSTNAQQQELLKLDSELRTLASNTVDEVEDALDELQAAIEVRFKPGTLFVSMTHSEVLTLPSVKRLLPEAGGA